MEEKFGLKLKQLRGKRSQSSVAKLIGITQQSYARYEAGTVMPCLRILHQICTELGVSADWLIGLTNHLEKPTNNVAEEKVSYSSECENCKKMQQQVSDLTATVLSLTRQLEAKNGK